MGFLLHQCYGCYTGGEFPLDAVKFEQINGAEIIIQDLGCWRLEKGNMSVEFFKWWNYQVVSFLLGLLDDHV